MMSTPEEIGAKINALGLWNIMEAYNFAVKPRKTVFPYFCCVLKGDGTKIKVRLLMLEGWQTLHDFVRLRMDGNFGYYSSPFEMPHFELVVEESDTIKIFRHDTGYAPQLVTESQREFVSAILWEIYGVMLRVETDRSLPMTFSSDRAIFSRVENADGSWADAPLVIPDPPAYTESVSFDKNDLKKAQDLPLAKSMALELDFRLSPTMVMAGPRPKCVYLLRAIDAASGLILMDSRVSISADMGLRGIWESMPEQVLREIIRIGCVPGEIRLCSGRVFRFLRSMCIDLPFKLSLHDELPKLEKAFSAK